MNEICTPGHLIRVAAKQGIEVQESEADMILGYLDGHDYQLMEYSNGKTMRHDVAMRDDHSGDCEYSIKETLYFVADMNNEFQDDEDDPRILEALREEEQVIDALLDKAASPCWYCRGHSYPSGSCEVVVDNTKF